MTDQNPADQGNAQAQRGTRTGPAAGGKDGTSSKTPVKKPASKKSTSSSDDPPRRPPYYIACRPLYIGGGDSGAMPVRAFSVGDRVPPDHVDRYGWGTLVAWPTMFAAPAPAADTSDDDKPATGDEE